MNSTHRRISCDATGTSARRASAQTSPSAKASSEPKKVASSVNTRPRNRVGNDWSANPQSQSKFIALDMVAAAASSGRRRPVGRSLGDLRANLFRGQVLLVRGKSGELELLRDLVELTRVLHLLQLPLERVVQRLVRLAERQRAGDERPVRRVVKMLEGVLGDLVGRQEERSGVRDDDLDALGLQRLEQRRSVRELLNLAVLDAKIFGDLDVGRAGVETDDQASLADIADARRRL